MTLHIRLSAVSAVLILSIIGSRDATSDDRTLCLQLSLLLRSDRTASDEVVRMAAVIVAAKPAGAETEKELEVRLEAFGQPPSVRNVAQLMRRVLSKAKAEGRIEYISMVSRGPTVQLAAPERKVSASTVVWVASADELAKAEAPDRLNSVFDHKEPRNSFDGDIVVLSVRFEFDRLQVNRELLRDLNAADHASRVRKESPHSSKVAFVVRDADQTLKSVNVSLVNVAGEWKEK